ncbi:hypothetical protein GCM10023231_01920 [Olivibacter ginsenosidimutans]|uniref:DUF2188 domain-containing protein n=1 Tax=Olivibacter ginsenosidimutans TaxID=1176537 RepID=A0ABP9ACE7_9SPHI
MKIYPEQHKKWTIHNFPFPEQELDPAVKEKAVAIANQLYHEGEPEGEKLFKKAINGAKEWFLEMEG